MQQYEHNPQYAMGNLVHGATLGSRDAHHLQPHYKYEFPLGNLEHKATSGYGDVRALLLHYKPHHSMGNHYNEATLEICLNVAIQPSPGCRNLQPK
jgi:hypothetical protein